MVIYDERLNRVSQYLSDETFDIHTCHELLVTQMNYTGRAQLGLRTYVGGNPKHVGERLVDFKDKAGNK